MTYQAGALIMDGGILIVASYDSEHLSHWYYQLYEIKKCTIVDQAPMALSPYQIS
jgi:hypothetical protein